MFVPHCITPLASVGPLACRRYDRRDRLRLVLRLSLDLVSSGRPLQGSRARNVAANRLPP